MKRKLRHILLGLSLSSALLSCDKYLDVKPEDKFIEKQLYSTERGINSALNGIYLEIAKPTLYGGNLSMSTLECMAQRYSYESRHSIYKYATYDYDDGGVRGTFDDVWTKFYTSILNINDFIANLDKYPGVISEEKKQILQGEAYGLRAFLHFDLLRLFGPMYSTADSLLPAIPYYTQASTKVEDILPANEVMKMVLADIHKAEQLLANDPIVENGTLTSLANDGSDFYRFRNLRMNYFAVKALEARVQLYRGNKTAALAAAKSVIDEGSVFFPWTDPELLLSEKDNPDRVFSSEVIFAVQNFDMYDQQKELFSVDLYDWVILAPHPDRLKETFENNENDYRYNPLWIVGAKTFRTFFKYADVEEPDTYFRYMQPLIRISEMYYIAAECEPSPDLALQYLNTVRYNRGLIDLETGVDLQEEIMKAYRKEFFGEGQLFYYYKRTNTSRLPDGSSPYSYRRVSMNAGKYVVPKPLSETQFRD